MSNKKELSDLYSQANFLKRMIAETPESDIIDLNSLKTRLALIEDKIAKIIESSENKD